MSKDNNNRSLFWYTALIFAVAIIMIVLAFLSQNNVFKNQPLQPDPSASVSISEKAAQLSEDNRLLLDQNKTLLEEKEKLTAELKALEEEHEALLNQNENSETLFEVYRLLYNSKKSQARELLKTVDSDELSYPQKIFYNILIKKTR